MVLFVNCAVGIAEWLRKESKLAGFDPIWALGLMSGTSMDGVDGAMLLTDGVEILEFGKSFFRPYTAQESAAISAAQGLWPTDDAMRLGAARGVVESAHAEVISQFDSAGVVGFHGQTLAHDPVNGRTHQLGDGDALAAVSGKKVVWDFRTKDVSAGGQGAPLAPFFHFACVRSIGAREAIACLNLGGVGDVTLVDATKSGPEAMGALLAFDTGPANAPLNDLMAARLGLAYDRHGALAARGQVDADIVQAVLARSYFDESPPKSLDRNDFADVLGMVNRLSDADAAATLTALTAACVAAAERWLPQAPARWLVSGGGAKNPAMMRELATRLSAPVAPIEDVGLDGDMLEAQAFAYLAVRVLRGLPTSAPGTTGIGAPVCGGQVSG